MSSYRMVLVFVALLGLSRMEAQTNILDDSTTIFRTKDGNQLSLDEVRRIVNQGAFTIVEKKDGQTGRRVVILTLRDSSEIRREENEASRRLRRLKDKPMGRFRFQDLNGNIIDEKSAAGNIVVMNFWFLACKPCIEEVPLLNAIVDDYKNENIIFLAPSRDRRKEIATFVEQQRFAYSIIPDAVEFMDNLGVEVYPTHILVDRKGTIREVVLGKDANIDRSLRAMIDKHIR